MVVNMSDYRIKPVEFASGYSWVDRQWDFNEVNLRLCQFLINALIVIYFEIVGNNTQIVF